MNGAASVERTFGDRLSVYKVRDRPVRHVIVWDRDGSVTVECECSPKPMGCRHCACVYMYVFGDGADKDSAIGSIRDSIEELAATSFDPLDYTEEANRQVLMYRFYDFIQKRIDRKISNICRSVEEFSDDAERRALYKALWDAADGFESPHDEWSKDTILANGGDDCSGEEGGQPSDIP